eukprot:SAG11_NODE_6671_length_1270_cov_1.459436_1_plen_83_part_10
MPKEPATALSVLTCATSHTEQKHALSFDPQCEIDIVLLVFEGVDDSSQLAEKMHAAIVELYVRLVRMFRLKQYHHDRMHHYPK